MSRRYRRTEAEVTADRLRTAAEKWHRLFTGRELDCIGELIHALEQIDAGERSAD